MATQLRSSRRSPSVPKVPAQNTSTNEAVRRQQEREEDPRGSLARKAGLIVEDARRQLQSLVGRRSYDEIRAAIRRERLALRELRQPPEGLKRDREADRRAAKRRVDALMRKLGVSSSKVERIQNTFDEELRTLLTPAGRNTTPGYAMGQHMSTWLDLTKLDSYGVLTDPQVGPPRDDPNDPHRWFWHAPPYPKVFSELIRWNLEGFSIRADLFAGDGGYIGSDLKLDDTRAGDIDAAYAWTEAALDIRFRAPITGRVEVVIHAQCISDLREVSMTDELGFSHARTLQASQLYMEVPTLQSGPKLAPMSNIETKSDGDPTSLNDHDLVPGKLYYGNPIGDFTIEANTTVDVRVGAYTSAWAIADDMTVHCRSVFTWQIQSVGIRIAY